MYNVLSGGEGGGTPQQQGAQRLCEHTHVPGKYCHPPRGGRGDVTRVSVRRPQDIHRLALKK